MGREGKELPLELDCAQPWGGFAESRKPDADEGEDRNVFFSELTADFTKKGKAPYSLHPVSGLVLNCTCSLLPGTLSVGWGRNTG